MNRLLHIVATPRASESRTLKVSSAFLDVIRKKYPTCKIDELNIFESKPPELTVKRLDGKYALLGGKELAPELEKAWKEIVSCIDRFMAADAYLISAPMWNFGIPYVLKHYIDVIVQPRYIFRYTEEGAEGLVKNRKMAVVTSRGGDYSASSPAHSYDLQEPYLRTVFGFAGITDITFINAQPMDAAGPQVQADKINEARVRARQAAEGF
jgi:FMN-dependent NADH-azoreductase